MRKDLSYKTKNKNHEELMPRYLGVENKVSVSPAQNSQISYRVNNTEDMETEGDSKELKRVDRIDANNHNRR